MVLGKAGLVLFSLIVVILTFGGTHAAVFQSSRYNSPNAEYNISYVSNRGGDMAARSLFLFLYTFTLIGRS